MHAYTPEYERAVTAVDAYTSRDARMRIRALHDVGMSITAIARMEHCTERQVRYALSHQATPQSKKAGRKSCITPAERDHIISWVFASRENRLTRWQDIPERCGLPHLGYYAVRGLLRREGFGRPAPRREPGRTPESQQVCST